MDKKDLMNYIDVEVDHWGKKSKTNFVDKLWFRYFRSESNAVCMIRRK